jgi:hypothetical protein
LTSPAEETDSPLSYSGISVSSAGDVNGDGLSDLIVGAYGADVTGYVPAAMLDKSTAFVLFLPNTT